jgi:hypothetical protein
MRSSYMTVIFSIFSATLASAQSPTIPEAVAAMRPGPYVTSRITEIAPPPFEAIVKSADLIVHGSLKKLRTYLSPDQRTLYTDFEVVPTNTIAAREFPPNAKPGPSPVILRQWGGETQIDGVLVKISEEGFPLLPVDEPLLLIMKFNADAGKYEVAGTFGGAFQLQQGRRLKHWGVPEIHYYARYNRMDLSEAVDEIRKHRK